MSKIVIKIAILELALSEVNSSGAFIVQTVNNMSYMIIYIITAVYAIYLGTNYPFYRFRSKYTTKTTEPYSLHFNVRISLSNNCSASNRFDDLNKDRANTTFDYEFTVGL
jgi:hypothetical protein